MVAHMFFTVLFALLPQARAGGFDYNGGVSMRYPNTSCPTGTFYEGTSLEANCCPEGQFSSPGGSGYCCPSEADCVDTVQTYQKCADSAWTYCNWVDATKYGWCCLAGWECWGSSEGVGCSPPGVALLSSESSIAPTLAHAGPGTSISKSPTHSSAHTSTPSSTEPSPSSVLPSPSSVTASSSNHAATISRDSKYSSHGKATSSGSSHTTVITSASSSHTPVAASTPSKNKASSTDIGAIVGGIIGGVAVGALVCAAVVYLCYRKRKQRRERPPPAPAMYDTREHRLPVHHGYGANHGYDANYAYGANSGNGVKPQFHQQWPTYELSDDAQAHELPGARY